MQLQYEDCKKEEVGNETMIEMLDCEVTKRKCDDVRKVEKTRGELEKIQYKEGKMEEEDFQWMGKIKVSIPLFPLTFFISIVIL